MICLQTFYLWLDKYHINEQLLNHRLIGIKVIKSSYLGITPDKKYCLDLYHGNIWKPLGLECTLIFDYPLTFIYELSGKIYHVCFFCKAFISYLMAYMNPSLYIPRMSSCNHGLSGSFFFAAYSNICKSSLYWVLDSTIIFYTSWKGF